MKPGIVFLAALAATAVRAAEIDVTLDAVSASGVGAPVGTVRIVETSYGLVFYPDLAGIVPGLHGFHVHENPSCAASAQNGAPAAAIAAGGHLDTGGTKKHGAPWGDGHLGDLPALYVAPDGSATNPVLAPRLKSLGEVKGRALMVHAGGDNHSDHPQPLGGGGARVACGVIKG